MAHIFQGQEGKESDLKLAKPVLGSQSLTNLVKLGRTYYFFNLMCSPEDRVLLPMILITTLY